MIYLRSSLIFCDVYFSPYLSIPRIRKMFLQVGKTYLQMKLTVDSGEGGRLVFMELSLDQFYHFMAQMEKAKAYLDFVAA